MKALTYEGIVECGLLDIAPGKLKALTPVIQQRGMGLGLAVANEPGYYPVPLAWCHGENWNDLHKCADEWNAKLWKHDDATALAIIGSSIGASNRAKKERDAFRVMKAAPDLLAALRLWMQATKDGTEEPDLELMCQAAEASTAAIAKAVES